MNQTSLSKWLKFIIIGIGICGLIVYFVIFPFIGKTIIYVENGALSNYFWPWLIFIWLTGIPCYYALVLAWRVAVNIGIDNSFCIDNAKYLKWISNAAVSDTIFFFAGNIILLLLNMNHISIILLSLIVVFVGFSVATAAAALSHLIMKAADLQEQSDLTI